MLLLVGLDFLEFLICHLRPDFLLFCLDWKWGANSPLLSVGLFHLYAACR
jgi:hypothetical protein